jgi:acetyl-CoA acyltransferase
MREAVIVEAVRTPAGKLRGSLSHIAPISLAALVLREVVARAGISPSALDDVVMGCVTQTGEQGPTSGGWPRSTPVSPWRSRR